MHVGNERLFCRLGMYDSLPKKEVEKAKAWQEMGATVGYLGITGKGIVAAYCVADKVRPEAGKVLAELKNDGIAVTMLTGDKRDAAIAIGTPLGLSHAAIKSELLPEQKLEIVMMAKEEPDSDQNWSLFGCETCAQPHLVLMAGDGVNDAPSLAAANIGVAMGAGAALAMETADVTLTDSNLSKLSYSINMGKQVIRKIKQNVIFALSFKAVILALALAGKATLWAAITSDVGAMILVTLNGMSLLPRKKKHPEKAEVTNEVTPLLADNV